MTTPEAMPQGPQPENEIPLREVHGLNHLSEGHETEVVRGQLQPANEAGWLEVETGVLRERAEEYEPGSHMRQRFDMAAQVRETAVSLLDQNDGNTRQTLRDLKRERREAIENGDTDAVANLQREIRVIKNVRSRGYGGPGETIYRLEGMGQDPQFAERGIIRQLGSAVKGALSPSPSNDKFTHTWQAARTPAIRGRRQAVDEFHASRRAHAMDSINSRREQVAAMALDKSRNGQSEPEEQLVEMEEDYRTPDSERDLSELEGVSRPLYKFEPFELRRKRGSPPKEILLPADAAGLLEVESHLFRKTAQDESFIGGKYERLRLEQSALLTELATETLDRFDGDINAALRFYEQELELDRFNGNINNALWHYHSEVKKAEEAGLEKPEILSKLGPYKVLLSAKDALEQGMRAERLVNKTRSGILKEGKYHKKKGKLDEETREIAREVATLKKISKSPKPSAPAKTTTTSRFAAV